MAGCSTTWIRARRGRHCGCAIGAEAGVDDPRWSLSSPWIDYDRDGDLDVYVANYLEYDDGKFRSYYAAAGYPGPLSYSGQPDALYRNNGDGTFTDVTKEAGLFNPDGRIVDLYRYRGEG